MPPFPLHQEEVASRIAVETVGGTNQTRVSLFGPAHRTGRALKQAVVFIFETPAGLGIRGSIRAKERVHMRHVLRAKPEAAWETQIVRDFLETGPTGRLDRTFLERATCGQATVRARGCRTGRGSSPAGIAPRALRRPAFFAMYSKIGIRSALGNVRWISAGTSMNLRHTCPRSSGQRSDSRNGARSCRGFHSTMMISESRPIPVGQPDQRVEVPLGTPEQVAAVLWVVNGKDEADLRTIRHSLRGCGANCHS